MKAFICGTCGSAYARSCRPCANRKRQRNPRGSQRELELAVLYRGGCTLEEIGQGVGLTRERVRQLINRSGIERESRIGWTRESLATPSATLLHRTGISRERRERKGHLRRQWRERVAVWVLRDLAADLGRIPTLGELGRCLGKPSSPSLYGWLEPRHGPTRAPFAFVSDQLYAKAGLGHPRRPGNPGHIHPRTPSTHCRRGHPLTPENVYRSGFQRQCKTCRKLREAQRYAHQKAARAQTSP